MAMPVGDICVLKALGLDSWTVSICQGGRGEYLARFTDFSRACEFAIARRDQSLKQGKALRIHYPDDCPCVNRNTA